MGIGVVDTTDVLVHAAFLACTARRRERRVMNCDCLLAFCARFDDRVAGNSPVRAPRQFIAHIDIDASGSTRQRVDWKVMWGC